MAKYDSLMTIGSLAAATGLKATALRYYEREGLLLPNDRSISGYRLYDQDSLERVQFIRSAQAAGFTLEDIRALLHLEAGHDVQCKRDVQELIQRRLSDVEVKMKDLKRVKARLSEALSQCQHTSGECPVLHDLKPVPKKVRRKR